MNSINIFNIENAPIIGKTKPASMAHALNFYCAVARTATGEWLLVVMRNHPSPLDKAFVITPEDAVMELLESNRADLLELPEFADLRAVDTTKIRKQMYNARGWTWREEE